MSVVDSREDQDAAKAKLADRDQAHLLEDLGYWAAASREHAKEYSELGARRITAGQLYSEAETWIVLIGDELVARKARARQSA